MLTHYLPLELEQLQSRGSLADNAGSLAGLHEKRKETLSQFFTPAWLVKFIWETLSPVFDNTENKYSLLDNSIGAAAMFRYADPERFHLYGMDADGKLVDEVVSILDECGYRFDIVHAHLETVDLEKFSAALINPPFSIPLSSPFLKAFPGITHYGKHGPDTSALSHEYAVAQALSHCDIVAAVVPATTKHIIAQNTAMASRLRAVFELPSTTFEDENVKSVKTDLLIFGRALQGPAANAPESIRVKRGAIDENTPAPALFQLNCRTMEEIGYSRHAIRSNGIEQSKPVITTPVTGNNTVTLVRAGRWIKLQFADGATEGKVLNAIYRNRLFSDYTHKYPSKTRYSGQFQLNLDVIAMQDAPFETLSHVCDVIRNAGGEPVVSEQLKAGIKAIIIENQRMGIPFGRTVYRKGTTEFKATAKRMALINRTQKGAAVAMGELVKASRSESGFLVQTGRGQFSCEHDTFFSLFTPENDVLEAGYWEEVHPPIHRPTLKKSRD